MGVHCAGRFSWVAIVGMLSVTGGVQGYGPVQGLRRLRHRSCIGRGHGVRKQVLWLAVCVP